VIAPAYAVLAIVSATQPAEYVVRNAIQVAGEHLELVRTGDYQRAAELAAPDVALTIGNGTAATRAMPGGRLAMTAMYLSMTERNRYHFDSIHCEIGETPETAACHFALVADGAPQRRFDVQYHVSSGLIDRVNSWRIPEEDERG
jgi:ketosteroid isomerase-like protein